MTAEIIVVTSGKGGVGKTTTSASLATGLAMAGKKTAVIDFDVGLRNLDLIMGCERRVVYDFVNVVHGEATLKQSLIKDKRHDNLYVLAASQTRDKDALTQEGVGRVLDELKLENQRLRKIVTDMLLEKMRLEEAAATVPSRQSGTQGVIEALLGPANLD